MVYGMVFRLRELAPQSKLGPTSLTIPIKVAWIWNFVSTGVNGDAETYVQCSAFVSLVSKLSSLLVARRKMWEMARGDKSHLR